MNYLAHAHLSFNHPEILIGNMIADYVKGKQILNFSKDIQSGITMHRLIDEFTDKHPIVKETKQIYRQSAARYDGSFLDITFDHFLAPDTSEEPQQGWFSFTLETYNEIDKHLDALPEDFVNFYRHMKAENWLYNYRYKWLIEKKNSRFAYHLKYLENDAPVYEAFDSNYKRLQESYYEFFPQLKQYVHSIV